MSDLNGARCVGLWWLFDSTELADHLEARAMCETCPALRECVAKLAQVRHDAAYAGGPVGTWAGRLVGVTKAAERCRLAREESIYGDQEARDAHTAYSRGDRGAWAVIGHRVWDRRLRRGATPGGGLDDVVQG